MRRTPARGQLLPAEREASGAAEPEARARGSASFAQFAQQHADEVEKQGGEEPRDAENDVYFFFADGDESLEDTPRQHVL